MHIRAFASLLLVAALAVLPACVSDPELDDLMATLPVAMTTGSAAHLADCIERDLDAATQIPEADKSELRARAMILRAHALRLSDAIDRHDSAKGADQPITLANLEARADALEEEHRATFREWGIWQVRFGVRAPEDVYEYFDYDRALQ